MCNNCQNSTCYECNQQPLCTQNDCSCPVKDLSTDCILYTGADLACSGIKSKTILTDLIEQLDEFICTKIDQTAALVTLINVGEGEEIYAGDNLVGKKIRTIQTTNIGDGAVELLAPIDFDAQDGLLIPAKTLDSDTLNFVDSGDTINIEVPGSTTTKSFFVDPFYSGALETGSRAKPFRTLKKAIEAFIDAPNGGTILSPLYGYTGKIELLNDVNVFSDLPRITVNRLKLEGNGFSISYYGTQDYFISTAYLVGLDPKSISGKLDYDIKMEFNNVRIATAYTNKFIHNLAYKSPTFSGFQNTSGMTFTNCTFIDSTWQIGNSSAYISTGQTHFGVPVFVQNTIPGDAYMIKSENVAWFNDGTFKFDNCKVFPTTSSAMYFRNTTGGALNLLMDYNYTRRNYSVLSGVDYLNSDVVNNITVDNDYPTNPIGRSASWVRVRNYSQDSHPASAGGQNALFKTLGDSTLLIQGAKAYLDFPKNLVQIDKETGYVELTDVDATSIFCRDTTYGAFKYTGSTPLTTQKYVWSDKSAINSVKQGIPLTDYLLPSANSATINGAMYNTLPSYPDDLTAIANGLILNCIYFNTTTSSLTKIT
jgi:hypothetical protein